MRKGAVSFVRESWKISVPVMNANFKRAGRGRIVEHLRAVGATRVFLALDVPEESLYQDYLFSNFAHINGTRSISGTDSYEDLLTAYSGSDLSEKIYNYLSEVVLVPREQLDSVIEILYQPAA